MLKRASGAVDIQSMLAATSEDGQTIAILVVGALIFALIFTVATLVDVLREPQDARFRSGSKTTWVVAICLTGVFGAFFYRVAGSPIVATSDQLSSSSLLVGGHDIQVDRSTSSTWFTCMEDGCDFDSRSKKEATYHRLSTGAELAPTVADDERSAVETTPSATPDLKTCPDCAEEVRAAARKCRFCGYLFTPVPTS